jgi:peptide/nickel transport system substrate-binding protein
MPLRWSPDRRQCLAATSALALWPGFVHAQGVRPLKVVASWEVSSLDPVKNGHIFTRLEVAETLVEVTDAGDLSAGLATRWQASANGLEWRFALRPKAQFHDGTPVTADAVVACLQRTLAQPGMLRNAGVQNIQAQGGEVVFKLAKPFASLPAVLTHSSTQVLAPSSYAADGSVKAVVGSGPYRVESVQAPQSVRTRRFEGFDGPKPRIEAVEYLSASRAETRGMLASSGQADLVFVHDPVSFARLRQNPKLRLLMQPLPRTVYLKVNAGHRFLADVRVRRALSLALDRAGMAKALMHAPEAAATQLFAPIQTEWHVPTLQPLEHNPTQASQLLREAGWQPGADGVLRNAQGQPFKVTLRTYNDRPELPPMATAIQAQFKAVGIDMAVSVGNSSEIPSGHQDGTLELALVARNHGQVPDPLGTLLQDFGPQGGDWGAMGWQSPHLVQTLAQLSESPDPKRRSALRGSVATVLQAELPVIPVAWYQHSVTASKRLGNVSVDPLERSYRISRMGWAA